MDGEITAESEYGRGSVFTACIPITTGDPDKCGVKNHGEFIMAAPGTRALVVDDNPINLTVAKGFLELHGIDADSALDGGDGVKKAALVQYDLIFMDHTMPGMDGIEAAKIIRKTCAAPIIALTGNVTAEARRDSLEAGMNDFLAKPILPEEVNRILTMWLPPEKQIAASGPRQSPSYKLQPPYAEATPDNPPFDPLYGLSNFQGNKSLYKRTLGEFKKTHHDDHEKIERYLAEDKITDARRIAHTLKSVADSVGGARVSSAAAAAEATLAQGRPTIPEQILAISGGMSELIAAIDDYLEALEPEKPASAEAFGKAGDPVAAAALLDKLERLLDDGSAECLSYSGDIERLLSSLGDDYTRFKEAFDSLDFPGAAELLPQLRSALADQRRD
ncbi:hypothetical protein FACS1894171_1550 [Clostridia bacterium]|nr:hypothetical protein FACS1894171_1550 [Clostridia bacterium]